MPFLLRATPRQDLAGQSDRSEANLTAAGHSRHTPDQTPDATKHRHVVAPHPPSRHSVLPRWAINRGSLNPRLRHGVGVIVRRELPADVSAARGVQVAAFLEQAANDEPIEAHLLDALRVCDGWLPALSIVAVLDDTVVGHVVTTRGFVGDAPALGLGPIGVLPSHQGHGIGLALMHATIGAADALGEPLIALLGSPDYYARFGFVASATAGVTAPEPGWGPHFQVRTLTMHRPEIRGRFRYARPFDEI